MKLSLSYNSNILNDKRVIDIIREEFKLVPSYTIETPLNDSKQSLYYFLRYKYKYNKIITNKNYSCCNKVVFSYDYNDFIRLLKNIIKQENKKDFYTHDNKYNLLSSLLYTLWIELI